MLFAHPHIFLLRNLVNRDHRPAACAPGTRKIVVPPVPLENMPALIFAEGHLVIAAHS